MSNTTLGAASEKEADTEKGADVPIKADTEKSAEVSAKADKKKGMFIAEIWRGHVEKSIWRRKRQQWKRQLPKRKKHQRKSSR